MAVLRSNLHPLVVIFILGEKFKLYIHLLFFFEKKNIGFFSLSFGKQFEEVLKFGRGTIFEEL